jgi:hypothetical protein
LVHAEGSGQPYTQNEFGGNHTVGAYIQTDIDSYGRGVYYSLLASAFLNAGSSGLLHWEFFDQYYNGGPEESSLMKVGLFKFETEGWLPRPFYHAWGLIMRHTRRGSSVYPMTFPEGDISGTALKTPDGAWTYIVTNANKEGKGRLVRIDNRSAESLTLQRYVYNPETAVTDDDRLIGGSGPAVCADGAVYVWVEADTFLVLTDIK